MKQLHNPSLHIDINQLLNQLDTKLDQMDQLRNAIVELVSNQESFTGTTGNSIRTYYQNIHLPFISFYCVSLENYKSSLQKLRESSLNLEEDKNGVIMQKFLEGELTDSLDRTKRKAIDLVDEANSTFRSISDIVHISHLNTGEFTSSMDEAQRATDDTVEDLINFDSKNSEGLESVGDDIQMMEQYIAEMENMVKEGTLSVESYSSFQTDLSLVHSALIQSVGSRLNDRTASAANQLEAMKELYSFQKTNSISTSGSGESNLPFDMIVGEGETGFKKEIEDAWDDGIGNIGGKIILNEDEKVAEGDLAGSIVDTSKMDIGKDAVKAQMLHFNANNVIPYGLDSFKDKLSHGQHIGLKGEAGVAKANFGSDSFPLSLNFDFAQADAKVNVENYTAAASAGASAVKFEVKLEPFNFFGTDLLEEWFGFDEYDPYIGVDISFGSAGVSWSGGLENSLYAAAGIGVGVKAGLEEDKDNKE